MRLRRFLAAVTLIAIGALYPTVAASAAKAPALPTRAAGTHRISYDRYSLIIDGKRTFIWSGEFHPFRLPSPGEWRDVLEKMKAEGYNAVSMYFDWDHQSAAPGQYDFTGVRNMDQALDIAARAGLYGSPVITQSSTSSSTVSPTR